MHFATFKMFLRVALAATCGSSAPSMAQCAGLWQSTGPLAGPNGNVSAVTTWDPDGPGGRDPLLVIAGYFDAVGTIDARSIAAWDGTEWSALGEGFAIPAPPQGGISRTGIFALLPRGERLLAAGAWPMQGTTTPLPRVAEWDGTSWQDLGPMGAVHPGATVYALAEFQGQVIAGGAVGSLQQPGYTNAFAVRWDGQTWQSVGVSATGGVLALASDDVSLFVGGQGPAFAGIPGHVLRWDGSAWTGVPLAPGRHVRCLAFHLHTLHAGVYESPPQTDSSILELSDDTWRRVGRGPGTPWDLRSIAGRLTTASAFDSVGIQVATWTGSEWTRLGTSALPTAMLTHYRGRIVAGGSFGTTSNNLNLPLRIASWSGSAWETLDPRSIPNGNINATARFQGQLIAGGDFRSAGSEPLNNIAVFDGQSWRSLGGGVSSEYYPWVLALQPDGDRLLVLGQFDRAGSINAPGAAWWDGVNWSTDPLLPLGSSVTCATRLNGQLYLGGGVRIGDRSSMIARRSSSGWEGFYSSGESRPVQMQAFNGSIYLISVGAFAWPLARFDPATRRAEYVQPYSPGGIRPRAMTVFRDRLIVAGPPGTLFLTGRPDSIGAYDGTTWTTLGSGFVDDVGDAASIYTLSTDGDRLVAIGTIGTPAGPTPAAAWWDGETWHRFPQVGTPESTYFWSAFTDRLGTIVSGPFTRAGGTNTPGVAVWNLCPADLGGPDSPRCDGGVTIDDLLFFLDQFARGTTRADLDDGSGLGTPDGGVTIDDLLFYLARFVAGC